MHLETTQQAVSNSRCMCFMYERHQDKSLTITLLNECYVKTLRGDASQIVCI